MAAADALVIRTPEGIVFSYPLAGPVVRFLAVGLDLLLIAAVTSLLTSVLSILELVSVDVSVAARMAASFLIYFGYGIVLEWVGRGQTLGKKWFRIRVMDAQGLNLTFHQVVLRNLLRCVDILPAFYLLGGLVSLASPWAQRLGDWAAGTVVVRSESLAEPDLDQVRSPKYNSLRDQGRLMARIRHEITPEEAGLALQAVLRRDALEPRARVDLFRDLAEYFKEVVVLPESVTAVVTDEQLVRDIVDVLFIKRSDSASTAVHQDEVAIVRSR